MRLIAHRGNYQCKNLESWPTLENSPNLITDALSNGYDAECDVWKINDKFFLGHDEPTFPINEAFLLMPNIWLHCKNIPVLLHLKELEVNCFWHSHEDPDAILLAPNAGLTNLRWTTDYINEYNIIVIDISGKFLESLEGAPPKIYGYASDNLLPMQNYLRDTANRTAYTNITTTNNMGNGYQWNVINVL